MRADTRPSQTPESPSAGCCILAAEEGTTSEALLGRGSESVRLGACANEAPTAAPTGGPCI